MTTVAVDFDGVIHRYSRGWQDGSVYDEPVSGAFDALRILLDMGLELVIYTTRAAEETGITEIRRWFREHDAPDLAALKITDRKPLAVVLVDDRALRFESWSQAMADLDALLVQR